MNTKAAIILLAATLSTTGLALAKPAATALGPNGTLFVAKTGRIEILNPHGTPIGMIARVGRVEALVYSHDRLFVLDGSSRAIVCYLERPGDLLKFDFMWILPFPRADRLLESRTGTLIVSSRAEVAEIDPDGNLVSRRPNRVAELERPRLASALPAAKTKSKV